MTALLDRLLALDELRVHENMATATMLGAALSEAFLPALLYPGPPGFSGLANARRCVLADKTRALIRHDRILRGEA